jgi:hypothetical protein
VPNRLSCLLNLRFALLYAVDEAFQHHRSAVQHIKSVAVGLSAQIVGFAQSGLLRIFGELLSALRYGVFGDELLGLLLRIGHDALGFAAGVFHDAIGMRAGIFQHAVGVGAAFLAQALRFALGVTGQPRGFGASVVERALRFCLGLSHHARRILRDARRFFPVVGTRLLKFGSLDKKRAYIDPHFAHEMAASFFDQLF